MPKNIHFEVINDLTGRRFPKACFTSRTKANRCLQKIVKKHPELRTQVFIYKTWTENGENWGRALN